MDNGQWIISKTKFVLHGAGIFILIMVLLLIACSSDTDNLSDYAENLRSKHNIPGMVAAVVKADTILEMFALGHRKHRSKDLIALDDRFHIGSNTKSMTSFVAAHLVEQGKIDWKTEFLDLYPEWQSQIDSSFWGLTLSELLSHRGKIQAFMTDAEFDSISIANQLKSDQRREFNLYALNRKPIIPASLGYHYSNAGYSIAAQMLEKASNLSWEELVKKTFNDDLGLEIAFSWPNKIDEHQPWGHWTEDGKLYPCPPEDDYDLDWLEPGGDVNISMPNYCRFIQMNLQGLSGNDNYLNSETYDLLHADPRGPIYAYGWANVQINGRPYSFHAGSAGTFLVHASIDQTDLIAYVIMMNTSSPGAWEVATTLRSKMEDVHGFSPGM